MGVRGALIFCDPAVDPAIILPFRYYVQGRMRRSPGLAPCNPAETPVTLQRID